ncbi:hypothetical protein R4Z10_19850 [Niallia sp. XMNu-256]|uniref:hypothetical protein n=1 Tax=Niallia sp. XMNu-256 TaxID=3082444 RepID=UPI0030CF4C31
MFQVRLFKGLKEPHYTAEQLGKAESLSGFWKNLLFLLGLTLLLSLFTSFYGIGNDILSPELNGHLATEFEAMKSLFAIGQMAWKLFEALFILTIPSLFFWAISDIEWKKFIVVQQEILVIFLLEKAALIPFALFLGITSHLSNPFSLGIIGQYVTDQPFILIFLAKMSIFTIWAVILQYKYVKVLAGKPAKGTALFVIGFNVILLFISTFITLIDLETLL